MRANEQVHPTRRFVNLGDPVTGHLGHGGFHVKSLEIGWGAFFAGVVEAVGTYEGLVWGGRSGGRRTKKFLGSVIEVIPCCSGVCELGLTSISGGRDLDGSEGGIG